MHEAIRARRNSDPVSPVPTWLIAGIRGWLMGRFLKQGGGPMFSVDMGLMRKGNGTREITLIGKRLYFDTLDIGAGFVVPICLWQGASFNEPLVGTVHPAPVHSGLPYRLPRHFRLPGLLPDRNGQKAWNNNGCPCPGTLI